MKAHVTDLKHGDCLIADTFNSVGLHVLPKGTVVYGEEITILMRHQIDYVDIEPRMMALDNEEMNVAQGIDGNFDQAIQNYESIFLEALSKGSFTQSDVDNTLQPLLEKLDEQRMSFLYYCCLNVMISVHTIIHCRSDCYPFT